MTSTDRRKLTKTEITELSAKISDLGTRRSELETTKKALVKPTNDELKHIQNQMKVLTEMWATKSIEVDRQLSLLEDFVPEDKDLGAENPLDEEPPAPKKKRGAKKAASNDSAESSIL